MTNFLDTLFIKRFCVPFNTDVEKMTNIDGNNNEPIATKHTKKN